MMKTPIESLPAAWYDDEKGSTPLVAVNLNGRTEVVRLGADWDTVEEED